MRPVMTGKDSMKTVTRKQSPVNVGVVVFFFIFLYMAYSLFRMSGEEQVSVFRIGLPETLSVSDTYLGLILRQETITDSSAAGYVDYYVREGSRAGKGDIVASIDETGNVRDKLIQQYGSGDDAEINRSTRRRLLEFSVSRKDDFSEVYRLKHDLQSELLHYLSSAPLDASAGISEADSASFHRIGTEKSGIIALYEDGYEAYTPSMITGACFELENYKKQYVTDKLNVGDFLFKTVTDEAWSIIFRVDTAVAARLTEKGTVFVTFLKNNLSARAPVKVYTGLDGALYAQLDFDRYMTLFVSDRHVNIRIDIDGPSGLKIPKSAITQKEVYLIPEEYLCYGGADSSPGFLTEVYHSSEVTASFVAPIIYDVKDGFCQVDPAQLPAGSVLIKENSEDRFTVRTLGGITGVYSVTKGYAVFRRIELIEQNDEYALVRTGTSYGLSPYDSIAKDGSSIKENEVIY